MKYSLRALRLLLFSPREYLFNLFTPESSPIAIHPFSPVNLQTAEKIISHIRSLCPDLPVYLIGSTGLQISGRGDIDLYASAPSARIPSLSDQLSVYLGLPCKIRPKFREWCLKIDGYLVEFVLIDPQTMRFKKQIRLFNILKNHPDLLHEYENIKVSSVGLSSKEYEWRRMEFFNRILSDSRNNS
jgi:hypothetical protein